MLTFGPLALVAGVLLELLQLETVKVARRAQTVKVRAARIGVQNFGARSPGCPEEFI
jgi:hypothetical protein